jgi:hypothetical protein
MPTFVFFQSGKEVERLKGANKDPIEQTIKKFYKTTPTKDPGYVRRLNYPFFCICFCDLLFSDRFEIIY